MPLDVDIIALVGRPLHFFEHFRKDALRFRQEVSSPGTKERLAGKLENDAVLVETDFELILADLCTIKNGIQIVHQRKHRRDDVFLLAQVLLDRGHRRLTLAGVVILECDDHDKEREQQGGRASLGYEPFLANLLCILLGARPHSAASSAPPRSC